MKPESFNLQEGKRDMIWLPVIKNTQSIVKEWTEQDQTQYKEVHQEADNNDGLDWDGSDGRGFTKS